MKKRITALLLCLAMALSLCLTACEKGHVHVLEKISAVSSTCTTAGNIEYYRCTVPNCGKCFSSADATVEIDEPSVVLAAAHTFDEFGNCINCGTVNADKLTLINAITSINTLNAEAKLSISSESQKAEGYLAVSINKEFSLNADLFLSISDDVQEETSQLAIIVFVRNGEVYHATVPAELGDDFVASIKEMLPGMKSQCFEYSGKITDILSELGGDIGMSDIIGSVITPSIPGQGEGDGDVLASLDAETIKLIEDTVKALEANLLSRLFSSEQVDGGYTLTFDLYKVIDSVFGRLYDIAETIDENSTITLSELYSSDTFKRAVAPLLNGITGAQLESILRATITEDMELPFEIITAGEEDAYTYIGKYLEIKSPGMVSVTIGSLRVTDLISMLGASEGNIVLPDLSDTLKTAKDTVVSSLKEVLPDLRMVVSFDEHMKLCGLSTDLTASISNDEYDEETGEIVDTKVKNLSISFKFDFLESAPELFDLTGFTYESIEATNVKVILDGVSDFFVYTDFITEENSYYDFSGSNIYAEVEYSQGEYSIDVFCNGSGIAHISSSIFAEDESFGYLDVIYVTTDDDTIIYSPASFNSLVITSCDVNENVLSCTAVLNTYDWMVDTSEPESITDSPIFSVTVTFDIVSSNNTIA